MDKQQFTNWINTAPPEDLVTYGTLLVSRIGQLDQTHRDRFYSQIKSDPVFSRAFAKQTA